MTCLSSFSSGRCRQRQLHFRSRVPPRISVSGGDGGDAVFIGGGDHPEQRVVPAARATTSARSRMTAPARHSTCWMAVTAMTFLARDGRLHVALGREPGTLRRASVRGRAAMPSSAARATTNCRRTATTIRWTPGSAMTCLFVAVGGSNNMFAGTAQRLAGRKRATLSLLAGGDAQSDLARRNRDTAARSSTRRRG